MFGIMNIDNFCHRLGVWKFDVVKKAAAQKCIGQFFFIVGGNDDDRAVYSLYGFAGLIDEKLHAIEFLQQIIRKLDIGFVYFINQQDCPLVGGECLPQFATLRYNCGHHRTRVRRPAVHRAGGRPHHIHTSP